VDQPQPEYKTRPYPECRCISEESSPVSTRGTASSVRKKVRTYAKRLAVEQTYLESLVSSFVVSDSSWCLLHKSWNAPSHPQFWGTLRFRFSLQWGASGGEISTFARDTMNCVHNKGRKFLSPFPIPHFPFPAFKIGLVCDGSVRQHDRYTWCSCVSLELRSCTRLFTPPQPSPVSWGGS
jgi:hypothetical protein